MNVTNETRPLPVPEGLNNMPADFQHPGGVVEGIMHWELASAVCPQPLFALASALTIAGTLYGRHVQTADGLRTNIFCMTVGHSSCGKDQALKSIGKILDAGEATHLRLGQVTSDSAIEGALRRNPRLCLTIDEAGHYFSGTSSEGAKGSPAATIKPALLELWSSAANRWVGKQRAPKDGKVIDPVIIDEPHICLYGATQPQLLLGALGKTDLSDGWLARNLFFISETRPKPMTKDVIPVPPALIREVQIWKRERQGPVLTIPTDPEAQKVFDAFNDEIYQKMIRADKSGDEVNYLYGKALENAKRIALILAVSRYGEKAHITDVQATFATALVDYLIGIMIDMVNETLAENVVEKNKKKLLTLIRRNREDGILKRDLTRSSQNLKASERDDCLQDLINAELIIARPVSGHGGGLKYIASEFASSFLNR